MTRVAFYAYMGYHQAVLRPVMDALEGRLPALMAMSEGEVVDFDPAIVVLPAFRGLSSLRSALPKALIGSVRHGLIAKRVLEVPRGVLAKRFDFLCVGDAATVERYRRAGAAPTEVWFTGYPQMDPLFRRDPAPDLGLDPDQKVILYAPTFNEGMSSAPIVGEHLVRLIRGSGPPLDVIVKPHPSIPDRHPRWMEWWTRAAGDDPRVRLLDPVSDVTQAMLAADLLISDASSVIFEFIALDRPIVLVTNPAAPADPGYDPADLPWTARDVGDEVFDPALLASTVARALAEPDARASARARVAQSLFGDLRDGRNSERVAERLIDLAGRLEGGVAPGPVRIDRSLPARLARRLTSTSDDKSLARR